MRHACLRVVGGPYCPAILPCSLNIALADRTVLDISLALYFAERHACSLMAERTPSPEQVGARCGASMARAPLARVLACICAGAPRHVGHLLLVLLFLCSSKCWLWLPSCIFCLAFCTACTVHLQDVKPKGSELRACIEGGMRPTEHRASPGMYSQCHSLHDSSAAPTDFEILYSLCFEGALNG